MSTRGNPTSLSGRTTRHFRTERCDADLRGSRPLHRSCSFYFVHPLNSSAGKLELELLSHKALLLAAAMNLEATHTTTIMSSGRLLNRVAIVTGASSGLGRAIALQLAAEGAKICCVDLYENPRNKTNAATGKADDFNNRTDGETTLQELHRLHDEERAVFVHANMTEAEEVEHMVSQCEICIPRHQNSTRSLMNLSPRRREIWPHRHLMQREPSQPTCILNLLSNNSPPLNRTPASQSNPPTPPLSQSTSSPNPTGT